MKLESGNRTRSASLGRSRDYERHYRYWTFLFDHLSRIIDEIFQNCEEDGSIDQCKDAILTLENYVNKFQKLHEWFKLNKNLETTPQRPNSVSWEVQKRLSKKTFLEYYLDNDLLKTRHCDSGSAIKRIDTTPPTPVESYSDKISIKSTPVSKSTSPAEKPVKNQGKLQNGTSATNISPTATVRQKQSSRVTINIPHEKRTPVSNKAKLPKATPQVAFSPSADKNSSLNRCNSFNTITLSSKYDLDEDGFQVVRYKQRHKASQLKINNSERNYHKNATENGAATNGWTRIDNNMAGDNRTPGRALQLNEKFLSPSRKRSVNDTLKKQEEKQAKAQEAREKLLEQKAGKFKGIVKKVEEIKAHKEEQQNKLKESMEKRLQRADEKRQEQINKIVRKAHDEDAKVTEILFINSMEADSKKFEISRKEKGNELRLQDLQEERQRKLEEKASKEAAFEKRRQALESEKQARIEKLKEQRMIKVQKIEQQQQEKEKERQELAFQKELDRKSKLSALSALHAAEKEELQKKIILKQEESRRRHEENMEQIRQKALELSVRSVGVSDDALVCVPYDTVKMCAVCKVIIKSEVYLFGHLRGKKHNDAVKELNDGKTPSVEELENFNLKNIIDAPLHPDSSMTDLKSFQDCDSEKLKQARKKSKKLKQRIVARVGLFEEKYVPKSADSFGAIPKEVKSKFTKIIKELSTLHANDRISGQWSANMVRSVERMLSDLERLCQKNQQHTEYFHSINGISLLTKLLSRILNGTNERPTSLTDSANTKLANFYKLLCTQSWSICHFFLQSSNIISMLDILYHRLNVCISSNVNTNFPYDPVVGSICEFFSAIFEGIFQHYSSNNKEVQKECDTLILHVKDIINYLVIFGVIDKLSMILSSIRGSTNDMPQHGLFVKQIIVLFSAICKLLTLFPSCNQHDISYGIKLTEDDTQFLLTLRVNQLCGTVSLLYGFLLHSGTPVRNDTVPVVVPNYTLKVALEAIRFFNYIALLDINFIQSILGGEGLSLQIRHICSYLIWYCSHHLANAELLHEVILLIGNFVVLNTDNQTLLQSGQRPTVVQQLCSLPFEYFSEPSLMQILFPTLIVCCFKNDDNMLILTQEVSTALLESYIEETIVKSQIEQIESKSSPLQKSIVTEKWSLPMRFSKSRWNEAKFYFKERQ